MNPYEATDTPGSPGEALRPIELRRIEPLATGKVLSVFYGAIGLLIGGIYSFILIIGGVFGAIAGEPETLVMAAAGVALLVIIPVFYAFLGGVFGAIAAAIYNAIASRIGGLQFGYLALD